ncbi:hypothetical protein McanCB21832_006416 [Microsporum canis]
MSDYPTASTPVKRVGLREMCEVNGRRFSRRTGTQQWAEYRPEDSLPPPGRSLDLSLVHHAQGPGEPLHWALFVGPENQPGMVYEVKGDAEFMTYQPPSGPVDVTRSASFSTMYRLAALSEQQAAVVREVADSEVPPRAPNRQSVKENCQGWAVRVIARLVDRGIVPAAKLQMAESMMQPIDGLALPLCDVLYGVVDAGGPVDEGRVEALPGGGEEQEGAGEGAPDDGPGGAVAVVVDAGDDERGARLQGGLGDGDRLGTVGVVGRAVQHVVQERAVDPFAACEVAALEQEREFVVGGFEVVEPQLGGDMLAPVK